MERCFTSRYFNPIERIRKGDLGENPNGINLLPYVTQVAVLVLEQVQVFEMTTTEDGTGVRDYIHVVALSQRHVTGTLRNFKRFRTKTFTTLVQEKGYSWSFENYPKYGKLGRTPHSIPYH